MQRQAKFKTYDMTVGIHNAKLKVIARNVLNSDVPIRYKISLRDDILAMKEKERLGFNFNRSLAASLRSRWDVVENATKSFLQEIVDMNDQIEDDSKKNERQIMGLIFTRSTNLGLESRVEQMGGLYMRVNFYKSVLEEKIKQLEPCKSFLCQCCELMGYLQPGQLLDRYAALNHVFKELYREYDDRISMMNKLQERLSDIKSETDHRHMLMHNEMSELHMNLKALTTRITYMEFELHERMDQCTGSEMELYNIKNSIHRSYVSLMLYRGLEPTDTDPFDQLEHIATRIKTTQEVIRMIREENQRRDISLRRFRREKDGDQPAQASESVSSLDTVDDNENRYDHALPQDANSNLWLDDVSSVRPTHGNPVGASDRSKYAWGLPPIKNLTRGLIGRKKSTRGSRVSNLLSQRKDMRRQYGAAIIGPSQKKTNPSPGESSRKNVQNISSPFRHLPEILEQVNETLRKVDINFSHPHQVGVTYKVARGNLVPRHGRVRADDTTSRSSAITKGGKLEDEESGPRLSKFKCLPDASAKNGVKENHNFNELQRIAKDWETGLLSNKAATNDFDWETGLLSNKAATTDFQTEPKNGNLIDGSKRIRRRDPAVKEMSVNEPTPCKSSRPPDTKKCKTVPKTDEKETNANRKVAGKIPADLLGLCTRRRLKPCADVTKKMEPSRDAASTRRAEPPWLCRREKLQNYLEILNRLPVGAQQTTSSD